ncbi:MAG: DsbA family protein [Candidatus Korobacteraceae bacterium]
MPRWLFLLLFRRFFVFLLLVVLGCSAQTPSTELDRRIARQIRSHFSIPAAVDIVVGERKQSSDFPAYETLTVTFSQGERKQEQEFLVTKDGSTLVRLTKLDISKDPYAEVMNKIDVKGRPVRGGKDAKVTIVNYDDFQCPFCARMYSTLMNEILPAYDNRVKLIAKDFPLTEIHPWATRAAVNANCLAAQSQEAYWTYSDYIHENQQEINTGGKPSAPAAGAAKASVQQQKDVLDRLALEHAQKHKLQMAPLQACLKEQAETAVRASMREGAELGVQATPTLFINGEKIDGAVPAAQVRAILDRALQDAGETPPAQQAAPAQQPSAPGAQ